MSVNLFTQSNTHIDGKVDCQDLDNDVESNDELNKQKIEHFNMFRQFVKVKVFLWKKKSRQMLRSNHT